MKSPLNFLQFQSPSSSASPHQEMLHPLQHLHGSVQGKSIWGVYGICNTKFRWGTTDGERSRFRWFGEGQVWGLYIQVPATGEPGIQGLGSPSVPARLLEGSPLHTCVHMWAPTCSTSEGTGICPCFSERFCVLVLLQCPGHWINSVSWEIGPFRNILRTCF